MLSLLFRDRKICLLCKSKGRKKIGYVCENCFASLSFKEEYFDLKGYEYVYSVLEYDKFLREHLFPYKYSFASYYYKAFGEIILASVLKEGLFSDVDYIIPVPLHRSKKAFRGYNQSELMAEYLGRALGIPTLNNIVVKKKNTKDQHNLKEYDRKKNLKDAFRLDHREKLKGKNILIVDDVLTTGTTLTRMAEILEASEIKNLYGLTLSTVKE